MLAPWKKSYDKPRQNIKKQKHHLADKGPDSQTYGFSSRHVQIWELDHKEVLAQRIDAFELWCWRRLLRFRWKSMEIKPINPKGNQLWIYWKHWCWSFNTLTTWCEEQIHWKRPWCWGRLKAKEKGMVEDEIVRWHHWLYEHVFEQTLEIVKDREACCAAVLGVA